MAVPGWPSIRFLHRVHRQHADRVDREPARVVVGHRGKLLGTQCHESARANPRHANTPKPAARAAGSAMIRVTVVACLGCAIQRLQRTYAVIVSVLPPRVALTAATAVHCPAALETSRRAYAALVGRGRGDVGASAQRDLPGRACRDRGDERVHGRVRGARRRRADERRSRRPRGPGAPGGPCAPGAPCAPCGPCGPVAP